MTWWEFHYNVYNESIHHFHHFILFFSFSLAVPAKPVQPVATEVQPGIVRIRWRNQNYMEYLDITYFRLEYREEGSNENKVIL